MSEDQTINAETEEEEGLGDRTVVCRPGRWVKVTLVGLVLAVIGGGFVWRTFEPQYEASAILRIKATPPYLLYPESARSSSYFINTQLQMLRDPYLVLGPAIKDLKEARKREAREKKLEAKKLDQILKEGGLLTEEQQERRCSVSSQMAQSLR